MKKIIPLIVFCFIVLIFIIANLYRLLSPDNAPVVTTNTSTSQPLAQTTQTETPNTITCPEVNDKFEVVNSSASFDILKLLPVETNISRTVLFNNAGFLVFKHFNAGGPGYSLDKKDTEHFGGRGPYYVAELFEPSNDNTSIIPSWYLPEGITEELQNFFFTKHQTHGQDWLFLTTELCGMGCDDEPTQSFVRISSMNNAVTRIGIPKNITQLHDFAAINNSFVIFTTNNTSTYIGFDSTSGTWKKMTSLEGAEPVQAKKSTVTDLIEKNGCFSYKTSQGSVVFTPHALADGGITHTMNDELDIFLDARTKGIETGWDHIKKNF